MLGLHSLFNTLSGRGDSNKKDSQGDTLLYKAVKKGNVSEVKRLLKAGADPNKSNAHHLTPLHQAAYWGETEIVELLLKYGAKVDIDNGKGWTALHSAAISGGLKIRKDIIDLLIESGADLEKTDKQGWTPKDYMTLWEVNSEAAEKLKQYLTIISGEKTSVNPPKKPSNIHTPRH